MGDRDDRQMRERSPEPPRGRSTWAWYGPGLLWMISAVGSGSVLFTPRVGSRYGYDLLWMLLIVALFMWVVVREVGRYTTVTGRTILDGYGSLPAPSWLKGWAIWLIVLPQLGGSVAVVAGLAALVGSALMIGFGGQQLWYAIGSLAVSIVLVVSGRYNWVERISMVMAAALVIAAAVTAAVVFPAPTEVLAGLVPGVPGDLDLYFVLPWIGFVLAGAAGVLWYSYWVAARGYGGGGQGAEKEETDGEGPQGRDERAERLRRWVRVMAGAAGIGVAGTALVSGAFLILGTELLRPEGIVPEGIDVAEDLAELLAQVWGRVGFWLLILGTVVALWGSILANQDGWGRTFADATLLLTEKDKRAGQGGWRVLGIDLADRKTLQRAYAVVLAAILPTLVLLIVRDPVAILSVGGIITAAHMPVLIGLTLCLNHTRLPRDLRAGTVWVVLMIVAGVFYLVVGGLYLLSLVGVEVV